MDGWGLYLSTELVVNPYMYLILHPWDHVPCGRGYRSAQQCLWEYPCRSLGVICIVEWGVICKVEWDVICIVEQGVICIVEQGVICIVELGVICIVKWGVICIVEGVSCIVK